MQRRNDSNSSTLQEDVPQWCLPNDCSQSGAFQCSACYENRILGNNLKTLRKLQSRVSKTGDPQLPAWPARYCSDISLHVSTQQWLILRRLFLRCHLYCSFLQDFYTDGREIQGETDYRSATILGIQFPTLFMHMNAIHAH